MVPRITALRSPAVDNLTHTLISVMVGEAIYRSTPASPVLAESARRNVAIAVMVIGGNFPDFDLIYTGLAGTKLDYLLHHRVTPTRSSAR